MTTSQEKRSGRVRFSVIDFTIILLVLACIAGVVLRYDLAEKLFSRSALEDAKITFVAEAITPAEAEAFRVNTKFRTEQDRFGTVTATETLPALIYYENSAGLLSSYEHETLLDLTGSFAARVLFSEDGCLLNGNTFIAAGSTFTVMANSAAVRITVISVDPAGT